MEIYIDTSNRKIRLTNERKEHIENDHPEMAGQIGKIKRTLLKPDSIIQSRTDPDIELFYRLYKKTPVTEKYLCVIVKLLFEDAFIITAYFTDSIKKGIILWEKK